MPDWRGRGCGAGGERRCRESSIRPFLDADRSEGTPMPREDGQNAMAYTKASVRAFIVSSTDERQGWPEPVLVADTRGAGARQRAAPAGGCARWL